MEFLFRNRSPGKRQIKPSQDIALLEDTLAPEESDDSEYKVEGDDDDDNLSASSSDGSEASADDSDSDEDKNADLAEERDDLNLSELMDKYEAAKKASNGKDMAGLLNAKHLSEFKVCGACLGQSSSDANEIVECDGCGVAVHEGCYGVTESGSVSSTVSSASTEPWFCEPCRAGLRKPPCCALCPSTFSSGVFKETDVGQWVHLICALYVGGVAFADPDRMTFVTLFEMNYGHWGKRPCSLCSDPRMARTGVSVQCDAGMCRAYFHASCAQAAGLLCEPRFVEPEAAAQGAVVQDAYLAHCSIHTDKAVKRNRRRAFLTHQVQMQSRAGAIQRRNDENPGGIGIARPDDESEDQRILRKLAHSQSRFTSEHSKRPGPWLPTRRIPRLLTTSASAVSKLERMGELKGMDVERQRIHEQNVLAVLDVKKKWNVPPALDVEFVAYFTDRQSRIRENKKNLAEQIIRHEKLRSEETQLRPRFELASQNHESSLETNVDLRQKLTFVIQAVNSLRPANSAQLPQPASLQPLVRAGEPVTPIMRGKATVWSTMGQSSSKTTASKSNSGKLNSIKSPMHSGHLSLKTCALCQRTRDQHLLAHCDTCKKHYHLGCLSPPLTRMPKKSKLYGWQCSECHHDSSSDDVKVMDPQELEKPRSKRQAAARALAISAAGNSRHNSDSDDFGPMAIAAVGNGERKKPVRKKSANHSSSVNSPSLAPPPTKMIKLEDDSSLADARQNLIDNVINADHEARKREERERRRKEKKRRKEEKRRREREREEAEAAKASSIVEDPDSGMCVVTIEPKPLKLKIKAPVKPPDHDASTNGVAEKRMDFVLDDDSDGAEKVARKKRRSSVKERDVRTQCDRCGQSGNNEDLVRCDECKRCFHFAACLAPPLKKSPKVPGYSWSCNDCAPSDVDSGWHLD